MTADYTLTVSLTAGQMLTARGREQLDEAIPAADLVAAVRDAIVEALHRALPKDRDFEFVEWFTIIVEGP